MALEGMHDEMIRQLMDRSASQVEIAKYEALWISAMGHSGQPLPCPLYFLGGETRRLKSISEDDGVGTARCEYCRNSFSNQSPESR